MPVDKISRPKAKALKRELAAVSVVIDRIAGRPARDRRPADEILGYDENGLPS